MMNLEGTAGAWIVYITALLLFLAIAWWILRSVFNQWVAASLILISLIVMATPFGVPGAQALAPAWLVAAFQFLTGDPAIATAALQPMGWLLVAFLVVLCVILVVRRRKSRTLSSPT